MNIKPWIEECCETGPDYHSGIRELWASYTAWLQKHQDMIPIGDRGFRRWPIQKQLRAAILAEGFHVGGYSNAPKIIGIRLRAS